jgi:hypothetical protein
MDALSKEMASDPSSWNLENKAEAPAGYGEPYQLYFLDVSAQDLADNPNLLGDSTHLLAEELEYPLLNADGEVVSAAQIGSGQTSDEAELAGFGRFASNELIAFSSNQKLIKSIFEQSKVKIVNEPKHLRVPAISMDFLITDPADGNYVLVLDYQDNSTSLDNGKVYPLEVAAAAIADTLLQSQAQDGLGSSGQGATSEKPPTKTPNSIWLAVLIGALVLLSICGYLIVRKAKRVNR